MRTTNNFSACGPYTTQNLMEMKYIYGTISCQVSSHVPSALRNKARDILHRKGSTLQDFIRIQLHRLVQDNQIPEADVPPPPEPAPEPKSEPEAKPAENIRQSVIEAAYEIVLADLKARQRS